VNWRMRTFRKHGQLDEIDGFRNQHEVLAPIGEPARRANAVSDASLKVLVAGVQAALRVSPWPPWNPIQVVARAAAHWIA